MRRTGRPARIEGIDGARASSASWRGSPELRSAVSAPIVVEGRLWGLITAGWTGERSPPADTEERMVRFAQLLDTAIANADSRDQLTASRARVLAAADEARRRVVRDLHDGAQQRLVHAIVTLKLARRAFGRDGDTARRWSPRRSRQAEQGNVELRELAHGILPRCSPAAACARRRRVVSRLDLPVDVDVPSARFPAEIESSAYFIVAEALTNIVKHAAASGPRCAAAIEDGVLRVEVRDDGMGGADAQGHGLVGIADRVAALGGRLEIDEPAGRRHGRGGDAAADRRLGSATHARSRRV